jgi:DNA-binding response OmpR family regulator
LTEQSTILIVEDEALIRWSLRQHLQQAGFHVLEAETGASALAHLSHDGIDGVLLDLRLADMNGLDVLRELRKKNGECRVWIMTAHGTPEIERQARQFGIDRFLNKPFDIWQLVNEVATALRN